MTLVAGVDSSTQSCKVVVVDADTSDAVRAGTAAHPTGTEIDPEYWWDALLRAVSLAGGLYDCSAIAIAGQQHGMVALDENGTVIRPALLWNDTRSAPDARDLIRELGDGDDALGSLRWAERVGTRPPPSLTVTKLRWLARNEPVTASRVAAIALPHDWLTWRLAGHASTGHGSPSSPNVLTALTTDRSDASGTGYWGGTASDEGYQRDLLNLALGRSDIVLPTVLAAQVQAGVTGAGIPGIPAGLPIAAGAGDNAAAALGLGAAAGDIIVSIGTSGTVFAMADARCADPTGIVAGFSSADGAWLPLVCTLNATRVLEAAAALLSGAGPVDHDLLAQLALSAPAGADGLVCVPYLEGERTPNRPLSTAALHGLHLSNATPPHLARAAVEGVLCGLADGVDALRSHGVEIRRAHLIGGGSRSAAVVHCAPGILGVDTLVPPPEEYVALGAARQAAWLVAGTARPPTWPRAHTAAMPATDTDLTTGRCIRDRYAEARDLTIERSANASA